MKVAKPFTITWVRKMLIGPRVDLMVHLCVFDIPGHFPCVKSGENRFVVNPPEFHIVPIFRNGMTIEIDKIADPAVVATTYGKWDPNELQYIVSVRLNMKEMDRLAKSLRKNE